MADLGPSAKGLRAQESGSQAGVPPGAFSWATVYSFNEKEGGQVKAACVGGNYIYTTSRAGVRRWDTVTGSSSEFIPSGTLPGLVHAIAVVGPTIWACTGDGKVALYDVASGDLKVKTFAAHQGEVLCIAPGPNNAYVITGGVDFNAKSWQPDGSPVVAAKYHHGAVECVLVTPMTPPPLPPPGFPRPASATTRSSPRAAVMAAAVLGEDGRGGGGKVWTGSADGTVFCWPDPAGTGQINEAEGKSIKVEGGKVKSLAHSGDCVWVGMDDGRIHVLRLMDGSLVKTIKGPHAGPVLALHHVAGQVWSGSGDKVIAAHDARPGQTPSTLFSLGDQGGYVKGLLACGWCIWAFTSSAVKIYTAESLWRWEADRLEAALGALEANRAELATRVSELAQAREEVGRSAALLAETRANGDKQRQDSETKIMELQLQAMKAQLDAATADVAVSRAEAEALQRKLAEAGEALVAEKAGWASANETAASDLAGARSRVSELESDLQSLQQELQQLGAQKAELEDGRSAAAKELEAVQEARAAMEAALAQATAALEKATEELESERSGRRAGEQEWLVREGALRNEMLTGLVAAKVAGEGEAARLRTEKAQLEEEQKQLIDQMAALKASKASLESDLVAVRSTGDATVAALRDQLARSQKDLAEASSRAAANASELERLRAAAATSDVAVREASSTRDQLRKELEEARSQLSSAVADRAATAEELQRVQLGLEDTRRELEGKSADLVGLTRDLDDARRRLTEREAEMRSEEVKLAEALTAREAQGQLMQVSLYVPLMHAIFCVVVFMLCRYASSSHVGLPFWPHTSHLTPHTSHLTSPQLILPFVSPGLALDAGRTGEAPKPAPGLRNQNPGCSPRRGRAPDPASCSAGTGGSNGRKAGGGGTGCVDA
ncbi:hypothetical protein Vafri_17568 [Volvox africanus]|uniref:Uncharacterized protein n=1 Tax=Volvox africanus TaxID=51714 RepID=A0A8J4BMA2_9CHLO|nr:hypothetical protein Vafri_17568 [Volvox africanus]